MDPRIKHFLKTNHILSLAAWAESEVYAASCFYCYKDQALIFASDDSTHHMQLILHNPQVSGTIHLCERTIAKIQGVQFKGEVMKATQEQERCYFQAFPIAKAMSPTIWAINLTWIKMTDNTFGFKKKIIWQRE